MKNVSYKKLLLFICCVLGCLNSFSNTVPLNSKNKKGTITINIQSKNTTCQKRNGIIIAQASNGTAPYSYVINSSFSQQSGVYLFLLAGDYTITVTDAMGQIASEKVTLTNTYTATNAFITILSNPTGCTSNDGSFTITGTGGTPPYMYSLDNINYQSSNVFTNMTSGGYIPVVKDVNGCVSPLDAFSKLFTIYNSCQITPNGQGFSGSCEPFRSNFGLINVDGGVKPYTFSLDGINYQTSPNFNQIPAGLYTIIIKDANGLIDLFAASIIDDCQSSYVVEVKSEAANCGPNGKLTIFAANGFEPFEYSIDGVNFQKNNEFTGLSSGNYTVTVRDINNIINKKYVAVTNSCLNVATTTINTTCGKNNGSITAQATNGVAPYLFALDNGGFTSENIFNNLAANTYSISVKDANGAITKISIAITDVAGPQIIKIDTTSTICTNNTGKIVIDAKDGTSPLQYSLDGAFFQNSTNFTSLANGDYSVAVKDGNGCITTQKAVVGINNNLQINSTDTIKICEGKSDILLAQTNASIYDWFPSSDLNNTKILNPTATAKKTTTYFLTASLGVCSIIDSVVVFVKQLPLANAGLDTTICYGQNAILNAHPGETSYNWKPSTYLSNPNSLTTQVVKPLNSTIYNLTVIGANGCTSINNATAKVNVNPPATVFAGNDTSVAIGQSLMLNAIDVNNVGFNNFAWSPTLGLSSSSVKTPIAILNSNIAYTVKAKTAAGCEGSASINIKVFKEANIFVPMGFSPNGDGKNDVLKALPVGIKSFKYFVVYDRYGKMVFTTNDANKGWDGKINGILSSGSFVWIAQGVDFTGKTLERKGSVIIVN